MASHGRRPHENCTRAHGSNDSPRMSRNATENDFWEGLRMVVALSKPLEEQGA